jgi:hypothetical protein
MAETYFVIVDPPGGPGETPGYAMKSRLEGRTFTIRPRHAARFSSKEEAEAAIRNYYRGDRTLQVQEVKE